MVPAKDRLEHRKKHIIDSGIVTYTVPGTYEYKINGNFRQVKVQIWGGGGGSGHLRYQHGGNGGGGGFVEALVMTTPGEVLEVTVGAGGQAGVRGIRVQVRSSRVLRLGR